MAQTRETFNISLPAELAQQARRLAKREGRTMSELFREAFRVYRTQQIRSVLDAANAEGRAKNHMGYTEADVSRLIKETRAERAMPAKK